MSDPIAERAAPSAQQAEAIAREADALKAALGRSRTTRLVMALAAVAFVVFFSLLFYRQAARLQTEAYLNSLLEVAQSRLEDRTDTYMGEVQLLVNSASPVMTQAFYSQAKQDLPAYLSAVEAERDALVVSLRQIASEKLDQHHAAILGRYEGILREEFPDFDEEQYGRMVDNLEVALSRLTERYYVDELEQQLNALYDSWDRFPMAEESSPGDPPLEDLFVGELIDLLQKKLTELDRVQLASAGPGSIAVPPADGSIASDPLSRLEQPEAEEPTPTEEPAAEVPAAEVPAPAEAPSPAPETP
jgi:hypothetical protein